MIRPPRKEGRTPRSHALNRCLTGSRVNGRRTAPRGLLGLAFAIVCGGIVAASAHEDPEGYVHPKLVRTADGYDLFYLDNTPSFAPRGNDAPPLSGRHQPNFSRCVVERLDDEGKRLDGPNNTDSPATLSELRFTFSPVCEIRWGSDGTLTAAMTTDREDWYLAPIAVEDSTVRLYRTARLVIDRYRYPWGEATDYRVELDSVEEARIRSDLAGVNGLLVGREAVILTGPSSEGLQLAALEKPAYRSTENAPLLGQHLLAEGGEWWPFPALGCHKDTYYVAFWHKTPDTQEDPTYGVISVAEWRPGRKGIRRAAVASRVHWNLTLTLGVTEKGLLVAYHQDVGTPPAIIVKRFLPWHSVTWEGQRP